MISPREAATRLGVSISLVYQLCREMALKHYRIGGRGKRGRILIEESELDRYRAACERDSQLPSPLLPLKHISLG